MIIIQNRYQIYNTCTCKNQIQFWGSRVWRIWRHDWSSQLWTQLKQYYCELKPEKKFTPEQDSNTWPLRYWCSAPPTELLSHWELVMLWVCNIPIDDDECKGRYERSYIWTVEKDMIFTCISTIYGYITNTQHDQLPVGLIARLVDNCTGIAEVMGSNPVQAWIFFQALIHNNIV